MECLSCRSILGEKRISPGSLIYEGTYWLVDHAYPTSHLGWLVIVQKRHAEALHELSREEFGELAEIQYRLAQVMSRDPDIEKEYMACFSEAPGFNHVHVHFVPRPKNLPVELMGPGIFALLKIDEAHAVLPETLRTFCEDFREKFDGNLESSSSPSCIATCTSGRSTREEAQECN